jgi:hypothetical protein
MLHHTNWGEYTISKKHFNVLTALQFKFLTFIKAEILLTEKAVLSSYHLAQHPPPRVGCDDSWFHAGREERTLFLSADVPDLALCFLIQFHNNPVRNI